jgi:hypothetical protein
MTTINWDCKTVDVFLNDEGHQDVVYNVHWIVTGVSDQLDPEGNPFTTNIIGTQTVPTDSITDFIPFEDLTNEQIVAWTQAAMGADQVSQIESNVENQIEAKINPVSETKTIA